MNTNRRNFLKGAAIAGMPLILRIGGPVSL